MSLGLHRFLKILIVQVWGLVLLDGFLGRYFLVTLFEEGKLF
jgi:hypothetical protein